MSNYLTDGWPLAPTSTVYMSGNAMFNVRRYNKAGIVARVELSPSDAQLIRDVVVEAIREAQAEAWYRAIGDLGIDQTLLNIRNPFDGVVS